MVAATEKRPPRTPPDGLSQKARYKQELEGFFGKSALPYYMFLLGTFVNIFYNIIAHWK